MRPLAGAAQAFADVWGYPSVETGTALIERADIDAIDICVPNHLHKEIAIVAAAAGTPAEPTFRTALETQKVCDGVLEAGRAGKGVQTGAG